MVETKKVSCQSCGCEISSKDTYVVGGLTICDDCYLERSQKVIACNPLATYSAKRFQESDGLDAKDRLTDLQAKIYDFIRSKGKASPKTLRDNFSLSQTEVENQIAILRHLELTKAKKEGNKIYIVPF